MTALFALTLVVLGAPLTAQKEPSAWGMSSGIREISFARNTCQNRARAALLELTNGLSFKMAVLDATHTTLSLHASGSLRMVNTRFYNWNDAIACTASLTRSDEEVARLSALSLSEVSADADDADPGWALAHAKRRALRKLILAASRQQPGVLAGRVTVAASEVVFAGRLITVRLLAHVELSRDTAFKPEEIESAGLSVAAELEAAGQLDEAARSIEYALLRRPTDLLLLRKLLDLQLTRKDNVAAADVQQQISDIEAFAAEQKRQADQVSLAAQRLAEQAAAEVQQGKDARARQAVFRVASVLTGKCLR